MDTQDIYTWCLIGAVVLSSTAGDVLSAQAMQKIGDFGKLRQRVGMGGRFSLPGYQESGEGGGRLEGKDVRQRNGREARGG